MAVPWDQIQSKTNNNNNKKLLSPNLRRPAKPVYHGNNCTLSELSGQLASLLHVPFEWAVSRFWPSGKGARLISRGTWVRIGFRFKICDLRGRRLVTSSHEALLTCWVPTRRVHPSYYSCSPCACMTGKHVLVFSRIFQRGIYKAHDYKLCILQLFNWS